MYFDLTVPSNVVVYGENDQNRADANGENEGDDEDDDWPRVISATTNLIQVEDEFDDVDPLESFPSTSTANQSAPQVPIVVKTEPGVEAVHLACHSANKWLLCKLRQERLHACLSTDARSVNVRVRDLTLNSCTLVAKLAPSYKDTHFHDLAKVRDAMNKLVQNAKVMTPDEIRENEGRQEMDAIEQQIRDILNEKGTIGMTEEEFNVSPI